jgi:hypothetical protein
MPTADCGDLTRRRSSPEVASCLAVLARKIAILDFIETVGSGVFLFSLYFTDGKRFGRAVGVALRPHPVT